VPLGAAVDGANVHDQKLLKATLKAIPVPRPQPTAAEPQHLCLDKGYTGEPVEREVRRCHYQFHIPRKGAVSSPPKRRRSKARRWKVERTHSWLNRARRLLIRWEKKVANHLGFLHLQFAIIALRAARVIG
jgi:putative transposase